MQKLELPIFPATQLIRSHRDNSKGTSERPYGPTLPSVAWDLGLWLSLKVDEDPENSEAPRPSCPKPCLCCKTATHTS